MKKNNMNKLKTTLFLIVLLTSLGASASPVTYECSYTKYSDEKGSHDYSEPFTPKFVWDKNKKTAYIVGNVGTEEVSVVEGKSLVDSWGVVTFVEVTDFGYVMTTLIDGKGKSVHSRNTEGLPSQSYGTCIKR
jgi:hypothetical protein